MIELVRIYPLVDQVGGIYRTGGTGSPTGSTPPPPLPSWDFALLLAAFVFWAISLILLFWAYGFGKRVTEEKGGGENATIAASLVSAMVIIGWIVYLMKHYGLSEPTELTFYIFNFPLIFVPAPLIASICPGAIATVNFLMSFAYLWSKSPEAKASRSPMAAMLGGFISAIQFAASIATLVMFRNYLFS